MRLCVPAGTSVPVRRNIIAVITCETRVDLYSLYLSTLLLHGIRMRPRPTYKVYRDSVPRPTLGSVRCGWIGQSVRNSIFQRAEVFFSVILRRQFSAFHDAPPAPPRLSLRPRSPQSEPVHRLRALVPLAGYSPSVRVSGCRLANWHRATGVARVYALRSRVPDIVGCVDCVLRKKRWVFFKSELLVVHCVSRKISRGFWCWVTYSVIKSYHITYSLFQSRRR